MTPKRRSSVFSLIFIVNCISKFNLIRYLTAVALSRVILPDLKLQLIGSIGGSHGGDSEGGD